MVNTIEKAIHTIEKELASRNTINDFINDMNYHLYHFENDIDNESLLLLEQLTAKQAMINEMFSTSGNPTPKKQSVRKFNPAAINDGYVGIDSNHYHFEDWKFRQYKIDFCIDWFIAQYDNDALFSDVKTRIESLSDFELNNLYVAYSQELEDIRTSQVYLSNTEKTYDSIVLTDTKDPDEITEQIINSGYYIAIVKAVLKSISHMRINNQYTSQAITCMDIINNHYRDSIYYDIEQELAMLIYSYIQSGDAWIEDGKLTFNTFITSRSHKEFSLYVKLMRAVNNLLYANSNGRITWCNLTTKNEDGKEVQNPAISYSYHAINEHFEKVFAKRIIRDFEKYLHKYLKNSMADNMMEYFKLRFLGFNQSEIACLLFASQDYNKSKAIRKVKHIASVAAHYANAYDSKRMDSNNPDWQELIK